MHPVERNWAIVAPWWKWPGPTDTVGGRLTRPQFQKYESSNLVVDFIDKPQNCLKFNDEDLVQTTELSDVPLGVGGKARIFGAQLKDGKWSRRVRKPLEPRVRKLFLDTHKRFYLVVCQIHCDAPGFPKVAREKICEAGFVVRRRTRDVSPELAKAAKPLLKGIATQRARLGKIAEVMPGLQLAALQRQTELGGATLENAKLVALVKQRGFVEQLLHTDQARLKEWADRFGVAPSLQGWFSTTLKLDKVGIWKTVEETPAAIDELPFPLYPLIPRKDDARHPGQFGTVYFGLVPGHLADHQPTGEARFDDRQYFEIRCFAKRHLEPHDPGSPCKCPDAVFWSPPTEAFRLASHYDLAGTAHRPVTIQMPDLNDLAAQTTPVPGMGLAKPPGSLNVKAKNKLPESGGFTAGFQICSLPIPLITIVAMFLFELFLPIVVLLFGLFWMLLLKFCIPPEINVAAGITAELDIHMSASDEAAFKVNGGALLADAAHDSLVENFPDPATRNPIEDSYSPIAIANWELGVARRPAPNATDGLEFEAEVRHP